MTMPENQPTQTILGLAKLSEALRTSSEELSEFNADLRSEARALRERSQTLLNHMRGPRHV